MLSQRSCDDVVDDAIESALRLAQEVVRFRMNGSVKEDLAMEYMWALSRAFSKLAKIAVVGIQVWNWMNK